METYTGLVGWIARNEHTSCGPPAEVYLNDPGETAPTACLTNVRLPVRGAQSDD